MPHAEDESSAQATEKKILHQLQISPRTRMIRNVKLDLDQADPPSSQEPTSVLEVNKAVLLDKPPALEEGDAFDIEDEISEISCHEEKPLSDMLKELQE